MITYLELVLHLLAVKSLASFRHEWVGLTSGIKIKRMGLFGY
jgi:hypothetical protein